MIGDIQQQNDYKKVLLSHYTSSYDDYGKDNTANNVPRMCQSFFNDDGMISFLGAEALAVGPKEYVQTPYIAAGFIFAPSTFLIDVPFDPYLDYLFVGEEILLSARAYTSGYNTYTPSENICFHYYTRAKEPKIWTDKTYSDKKAFNTVKKLLGLPTWSNSTVHPRYGLGTIRSLKQFYDYAGINLYEKRVEKNFCRPGLKPDTIEIKALSITLRILFAIMVLCIYLTILAYMLL
jgi:hypothetical protein